MVSMVRLHVAVAVATLAMLFPALSSAQSSLIFVGGGFSTPQRVFGDFTVVHPSHLAFGAQLGMSGVKVGAGAWLMSSEPFSPNAVMFRAVLLSTYGSPIGVRADRIYVGGEVEGSWLFIPHFHIGVVWPAQRRGEQDSVVVTAGVGFRFPINLGWMGGH